MQHRNLGAAGRIGVAVLATYPLVGKALCTILESSRDIVVSGTARDSTELLQIIRTARPQVVLLSGDGGVDFAVIVPQIKALSATTQVIVLTDPDALSDHTAVVKLGVAGIVELNQHARILIRAVEQVADGETWLSQKLVARLVGGAPPERRGTRTAPKGEALTNRELEVIAMIGRGMKNKEISQMMFISEATVRHHLSTVYSKLHIDDRLNLVIYAYQNNLIRNTPTAAAAAVAAVIPAQASGAAAVL